MIQPFNLTGASDQQQWRLVTALHISNGYNLHGIISPITVKALRPAAHHMKRKPHSTPVTNNRGLL
jgi:hypothetical protein